MKNNTKLIVENWRKFLKEGTEGIDSEGMVQEEEDQVVDPSDLPPAQDADLSGSMTPRERNEALKSIYCELVEQMSEEEVDAEIERLQSMNLSDDQLNRLAYPEDDTPYERPELDDDDDSQSAGYEALDTDY